MQSRSLCTINCIKLTNDFKRHVSYLWMWFIMYRSWLGVITVLPSHSWVNILRILSTFFSTCNINSRWMWCVLSEWLFVGLRRAWKVAIFCVSWCWPIVIDILRDTVWQWYVSIHESCYCLGLEHFYSVSVSSCLNLILNVLGPDLQNIFRQT